jgi:hypothetical protein
VVLQVPWSAFIIGYSFVAQAYFSVSPDFQDLDFEHVAFLDHIGHLVDTMVGQLRDVHQAIGSRHDLNKSAEIGCFDDFAFVDGADLGFPGDFKHRLFRGSVPSSAEVAAILTMPSSSISMRVLVSLWSPRITLPPGPMTSRILSGLILMMMILGANGEISLLGLIQRFEHLVKNVQPSHTGLLQGFLHDVLGEFVDFDVHLQGGDALAGAGYLEIHVTGMVLIAEDVGQDTTWSPSFTSPMAMPATGALMGTPPSIRARVPAQTVPMEEDPLDSSTSDTSRMV